VATVWFWPYDGAMSKHGRMLVKFNLRLPAGLKSDLTLVAMENNRSLNAEIIARLRARLTAYRR
jgi:predicted HicB family RNase H-like nuclease